MALRSALAPAIVLALLHVVACAPHGHTAHKLKVRARI